MAMEIRPARASEIAALTALSGAAFHSDVAVGGAADDGPPEYENEAWHESMRAQGHLYSALCDGALVGGALLFRVPERPDAMYVGRIFIDPRLHRRGLGTEMMRALEGLFADVHDWYLDTPAWNARTNAFYRRLGYREVKRDGAFVYYQKRVPEADEGAR